jgi:hypothetical protein
MKPRVPKILKQAEQEKRLMSEYYSYAALRRAGFSSLWRKKIQDLSPVRIGSGMYLPKRKVDEFLATKGFQVVDKGDWSYEIHLVTKAGGAEPEGEVVWEGELE